MISVERVTEAFLKAALEVVQLVGISSGGYAVSTTILSTIKALAA